MSHIYEARIFSGTSNPGLGEKINKYLNLDPGQIDFRKFSDGEIWVKYKENIRGRDVFIVQSTQPPAQNLMELLIMIDAAKRSSARRITAVIPYFGYARQDRKDQPRVAITAKLVANLLTVAGADRIITMDLHAAQIQGYFDIPVDHLYASRIFTNVIKDKLQDLKLVSPDFGGIKLARSYANRLDAGLVVIDKRRPTQNVAEIMNIMGEVEGKNLLIVDDLIDTGGTFANTISALKERGANKIYGAVTHALLSGQALEKLEAAPIDKLYITDSIPFDRECNKIEVLSSAELLAEAIVRSNRNESVSSLFEVDKS